MIPIDAQHTCGHAGERVERELARAGLLLGRTDDGLVLTDGAMSLRADFRPLLKRTRPCALQRELLVRAAKLKPLARSGTDGARAHAGADGARPGADAGPWAIDATAGLGEDAFLLAAAGFRVQLFERNAVIAALLADALQRAARTPELAPIAARMHLVEGDSVQALRALAPRAAAREAAAGLEGASGLATRAAGMQAACEHAMAAAGTQASGPETPASAPCARRPDVVLLDPMFPEKHKSAQVKKKLQLLQRLERPCDDEEALLCAAIEAGPRKVVVKRPAKGPFLAGRAPDYSLQGKAVRFDVFAN